jgi:hypothetical protein
MTEILYRVEWRTKIGAVRRTAIFARPGLSDAKVIQLAHSKCRADDLRDLPIFSEFREQAKLLPTKGN